MAEPLFPIDVPFRGARTYLHSASIFDFLVGRTGATRSIRLGFQRVLTRRIAAFEHDPALPAHFMAEGVRLSIGEVDGPAPPREPYDEDSRLAGCVIEGDRITSGGAPGTLAERLIALNKRLIEVSAKPDGKVIFGNMTLAALPAPDSALSVQLRGRAKGFFLSQLYADGSRIGEMVFAEIAPDAWSGASAGAAQRLVEDSGTGR